jgi:hypothetical protein
MPDNQESGMLEDFCRKMIDPAQVAVIEECLAYARRNGCATFKAVHHSKALVHSYLALQDEPGRPLGQAITANSLRGESDSALKFVTWLRRLFVPEAPPVEATGAAA